MICFDRWRSVFFAIIIIIIILVGLYFLFGLVDLWFRLSRSAGQGPLNWVDAFVLFYLFFFPFNCRARPSLEPFNFLISLNGGDLIFHLKPLKKSIHFAMIYLKSTWTSFSPSKRFIQAGCCYRVLPSFCFSMVSDERISSS